MGSNTQDEINLELQNENSLKIRTFKATIEHILLYGSECWTINSKMRIKIDGCYTRLLRIATNISLKDKVTNVPIGVVVVYNCT